jgi:uncharacterized protein
MQTVVAAVAIIYIVVCTALFLLQRTLIYHPTPVVVSEAPTESLAVDGAVLALHVLRRPGGAALLYFGGNAEPVGASIGDYAALIPDRTLVFVNYRGYGGSTGRPSEAALVSDALAVFDHVHRDYPDIAVAGRSLGSGIAMQLAAQRAASRMVLVTPYDRLVDVGQRAMPLLPVKLLAKDRYDSLARVPAVRCPVLVLIATADTVVGADAGRRLGAAFPSGQARLIEIVGAHHNDISLWPAYATEFARFLSGASP